MSCSWAMDEYLPQLAGGGRREKITHRRAADDYPARVPPTDGLTLGEERASNVELRDVGTVHPQKEGGRGPPIVAVVPDRHEIISCDVRDRVSDRVSDHISGGVARPHGGQQGQGGGQQGQRIDHRVLRVLAGPDARAVIDVCRRPAATSQPRRCRWPPQPHKPRARSNADVRSWDESESSHDEDRNHGYRRYERDASSHGASMTRPRMTNLTRQPPNERLRPPV
jgi:hypothetical protein